MIHELSLSRYAAEIAKGEMNAVYFNTREITDCTVWPSQSIPSTLSVR
jgi:hypothetical protein